MNITDKNFISVVVCTYNRCESLRQTLDSLLGQEINGGFDYEVIVVDNNSRDKTKEIVNEYIERINGRLRYIFESRQGLSCARNRGIKEARGEIVSFIDDDCIATASWLQNIYNTFVRYNPLVVGGKAALQFNRAMPDWYSSGIAGALGLCDKGDKMIYADKEYDDVIGIGANISFKKEIFDIFGLFRTDLGRNGNKLGMGEETEMYWRIKRSGRKCIYTPSVIVYHNIDEDKLRKNYIRKWFIEWGKWCLFVDTVTSKTVSKKILGIPCWRYKDALKDLINLFLNVTRGSPSEGFYREMRLICFLSYCFEKLKLIGHRKRFKLELAFLQGG
jgi:glycosyltransferase involved in cell wall biosynthesis